MANLITTELFTTSLNWNWRIKMEDKYFDEFYDYFDEKNNYNNKDDFYNEDDYYYDDENDEPDDDFGGD